MSAQPLARRIALVASGAVLLALATGAAINVVLLTRAASTWEARLVSGLAHHMADMVRGLPATDAVEVVSSIDRGASGLDIHLAYLPSRPTKSGGELVVPITGGGGYIIASSGTSLTRGLRATMLQSSAAATLVTVLLLLVAIAVTVRLSFVEPLRSVLGQLRAMRRGGWLTSPPIHGTREVQDLASEVASVGVELETRVEQWVEAERLGASEGVRLRYVRAASPMFQEAYASASQLLAEKRLTSTGTRALRHLLTAVDDLSALLRQPLAAGPPRQDDSLSHSREVTK